MLKGKLNFNLDFLERLFKSKAPPLIGCDISSSSVKLVEIVDAGKNVYRVERYSIEPLPRDAVVDGNINNLEAVSDCLKRGWKRMGTNCQNQPEVHALTQALRAAVPSLSNSLISLIKDTSLAAVLTVPEIFQAAQRIASVTYEPLILYTETALIYLVFTTLSELLFNHLNQRLSIGVRRQSL